ncbi:hypothetical protein RND71_025066 [Anisodus tanguticus]|uniref:Uncharacterized protein n=1 Tax=Anisodus tanguticus TaxID=243964 RepID=A0AAE1VD36_9SOLA|nr:hypothetical protein RND71_025066 [Anisodus tanguticus]
MAICTRYTHAAIVVAPRDPWGTHEVHIPIWNVPLDTSFVAKVSSSSTIITLVIIGVIGKTSENGQIITIESLKKSHNLFMHVPNLFPAFVVILLTSKIISGLNPFYIQISLLACIMMGSKMVKRLKEDHERYLLVLQQNHSYHYNDPSGLDLELKLGCSHNSSRLN